MSLTVNLWSRKNGELERFLESYYDGDTLIVDIEEIEQLDEIGGGEWSCVYNRPLEAVDMISAVMDNNDKYQISICVQIDEGQMHIVTQENYNEVIKDIFLLFHNESVIAYN